MRCRNIQHLLPDFFSDGLTAAETAEVNHHLVKCESCSRQAEQYHLLFSRMARKDGSVVDTVDWGTFGVHLNEKLDAPAHGFHTKIKPVYAYAAAAVVVVGLIGILLSGVFSASLSSDEIMYSEIEAALGVETVQLLPYESVDDVMVITGGGASAGVSSALSIDVFDAATVSELEDMFLTTLDGEILLEDNLDYLSHSEALGLLSEREADDILKTIESQTFINN